MTKREQQILTWIKENPLISQQEIADLANITRSSAAVHISNLMKKGKILGKGYVIQESNYVTVIGAVNVDIVGTSSATLTDYDSNPGVVGYSFGGVGRNIADNIARCGMAIEMITCLGDDMYGKEIAQNCRDLGIGLNHSLMLSSTNTSTYLCINDEHGEMRVAVADMNIYQMLTPDFLRTKLDVINRSGVVVIDTNLSEEAIGYLMEHVSVPIFVDPVSTNKAKKLLPYLHKIHTIKPNRIETELLSGVAIQNDKDLAKAASVLLDRGIQSVFISLGSEGVYYANKHEHKKMPSYPTDVINTTGCGDAFMAALVYGYQQEYSTNQQAKLGLAAASICAESTAAISNQLTTTAILDRIERNGEF